MKTICAIILAAILTAETSAQSAGGNNRENERRNERIVAQDSLNKQNADRKPQTQQQTAPANQNRKREHKKNIYEEPKKR